MADEDLPELPPLDDAPVEPPKRAHRKTGRGRAKLRRRPAASSKASSAAPSANSAGTRSASAADVGQVEADLTELQVVIGMGLTPALPVTGAVMISRAAESAAIMVQAAQRDPRVWQVLVYVVGVSVWAQLLGIFATWTMAVAVDAGRLNDDNPLVVRRIGVEVEQVRAEQEKRRSQRQHAPDEAPLESWQPAA